MGKPAGDIFTYQFRVNKKLHNAIQRFVLLQNAGKLFFYYSIKNIMHSHLLINKNSFKNYNLSFPDTLQWIYHCEYPGLFQ
jgi:hypothetical protein